MLLTLDNLPPSVNALYVNSPNTKGRGRFKSGRYKAWEKASLWEIKAQQHVCNGGGPLNGKIKVSYSFKRPDRRRRDLGNLEKAMSDLLVKANVIEDDSLLEDIRLTWSRAQVDNVVIVLEGMRK